MNISSHPTPMASANDSEGSKMHFPRKLTMSLLVIIIALGITTNAVAQPTPPVKTGYGAFQATVRVVNHHMYQSLKQRQNGKWVSANPSLCGKFAQIEGPSMVYMRASKKVSFGSTGYRRYGTRQYPFTGRSSVPVYDSHGKAINPGVINLICPVNQVG